MDALSHSCNPITDFKDARKSQSITIPNKGHTKTLNIIGPDKTIRVEEAISIKFKLPTMDLMILLSWGEILGSCLISLAYIVPT